MKINNKIMRVCSLEISVHALLVIFTTLCISCTSINHKPTIPITQTMDTLPTNQQIMDTATFGGGCFWCTEAIFQQVEGVEKVVSGYAGGSIENPTYEQICTGTTKHAEVIQVYYNAQKVDYGTLLEIFWKTHDPTTLNKQGNDVGTQYRSVVFYHNEKQKETAEYYKQKIEEEKIYSNPIITEITPISNFYSAEKYHQNYYNQNKDKNPYCTMVVTPKVEKFEKIFKDKMKK